MVQPQRGPIGRRDCRGNRTRHARPGLQQRCRGVVVADEESEVTECTLLLEVVPSVVRRFIVNLFGTE